MVEVAAALLLQVVRGVVLATSQALLPSRQTRHSLSMLVEEVEGAHVTLLVAVVRVEPTPVFIEALPRLLSLQVEVVEGGVVTRLLTLVEQVELVVAQLVSMVVHLLQTVVAHVAPLVPVELEVLAPTLGLRGLR